MERLFKTFIILNTLIYFILGWAAMWFIDINYSVQHLSFFPIFPFVMWAWGLTMNYVVFKSVHKDARRLANIYMLLKLIKNLVAGALVLLIFFKFNADRTPMLVTVGIFYMINLSMETLYIALTEKKIKKERQDA